MARTDAIVLGAGIVGTSIALQLARRGLSVALVDRRRPGQETSYGNAGVLEGNTLFPHLFPTRHSRPAADRAQAFAAGELSSALPAADRAVAVGPTAPTRHGRGAHGVRAGDAAAVRAAIAEHEKLMQEAGAERYLRKTGWIKLYRNERSFAETQGRARLCGGAWHRQPGARCRRRSGAGAVAGAAFPACDPLGGRGEPDQSAGGHQGVCGAVRPHGRGCPQGRRADPAPDRRPAGASTPRRARSMSGNVVVALGPWAPDLLDPLGIRLPMKWKRGYHRHFRPRGGAGSVAAGGRCR